MALNIRNKDAERVVRQLAKKRGVSLTEAVYDAALRQLQQPQPTSPIRTPRSGLRERIKAIQDDFSRFPKTGLKADKAFYDSLSDEE